MLLGAGGFGGAAVLCVGVAGAGAAPGVVVGNAVRAGTALACAAGTWVATCRAGYIGGGRRAGRWDACRRSAAGMTGAGGLVVWRIFRGEGWAGSHCDLRSFRGAVSIPLGTAGRRTAVHAVGFGRAGFIGVVAGCAEKTQGTLQK